MEFFVVSTRDTGKGCVLVTDKNLRIICNEKIPARAVVDVEISEFWTYKGAVYARADKVVVLETVERG